MWIENIGAWGDSITYGAGDAESLGWVGRLRRRVEHDHATGVYNFGVSGDTSADVLKRFEVERDSVNPELILIAIGTNDAIFTHGNVENCPISSQEYYTNLKTIFAKARQKAKQVFAVGLTTCNESMTQPVPWSETGKSYRNDILKKYDEVLAETAKDTGVSYIPMWEVLTEADLADGLHPNASGYEKMYVKIHEAIRPLLG